MSEYRSGPPGMGPFGPRVGERVRSVVSLRAAPAPHGLAVPGQMRSQTTIVAGVRRRFVLALPERYPDLERLPLLISLHDRESSPEQHMLLSGLQGAANAHGFAVLAPEAGPGGWNLTAPARCCDDLTLIQRALSSATLIVPVDCERLVATGFGQGARMLAKVAAHLPEPLRALAAVGDMDFAEACPPIRTPAVLGIQGGHDPRHLRAQAALSRWAEHNGWHSPLQERIHPRVTCTLFGAGIRRVVGYLVHDLGPAWPGFPFLLEHGLPGPTSAALNATATMMRFFDGLLGLPFPSREPAPVLPYDARRLSRRPRGSLPRGRG